jgi:PPOX class probable F420-dependent enzyme
MPDAVTLTADQRAFIGDPHFAILGTVAEDGSPRQAVVWYRLEADGSILVNSAEGRRWPADLRREPRVSVAIPDRSDGYRWIGIQGAVEAIVDDQGVAQADIAALARRYHEDEPEKAERLIRERFERQHRVSFRIRPLTLHDHLD